MANIFSLYGSVFIDNEKANKSIDETTEKGKKTGSSFKENFGAAIKSVASFGTAVVGSATTVVTGLTAMATQTANTADTFDKASLRTGLEVEELQRLNYAAGQSGVEMTSLEKSAKKLNERLSEISEGNEKSSEMFEKLGVSVKDSEGNMRSSTDIYNDTLLALANMGDTAEATAIGTDILGKAYTDLKPLLASGADGITELKERADDLGIVMGKDAVSAGVVFGDTMSDIKQSLGGSFNKIMSSLIPIIQVLLNLIIDNMPVIQGMIDTLAPVLISTLEQILPVFIQFAEMLLPIILDLLSQLLPPLSEIIASLLPIFTDILQILLPPMIQIVQQLLPVLLPLIQAILPLLKPITDLLLFLTNTVLMPCINVIMSLSNALSQGLSVALKALGPVINSVGSIFKDVFGGLFNIVKTPINFIIDGINTFIQALNQIKVPDWVPVVGGKGINLPLIKKLRVGMDYVPYDEMPAILHKGETVLNKDEAEAYRNRNFEEKKETTINYYNNITVEKMEVRNDNDINRIAEELYYLLKKKVS